jgi:prophage tail gpP-like protein
MSAFAAVAVTVAFAICLFCMPPKIVTFVGISYEVVVDGWTYWDGANAIPYAPNTTADVDLDALGGVQGRYYLHKTAMREDARGGAQTVLSLVHPDVWRLLPG